MSATRMLGALDADPTRIVRLSELLAKTDPSLIASAIYELGDTNRYSDADKALVAELNKYKGEHATPAALEAAYPAASAQDDAWANVESTDTVWVVDADAAPRAWKNTNATTAPADIDAALSKTSTNAVTNQAVSAAIEGRTVGRVHPLLGDSVITSFNITHSVTAVVGHHVRVRATKEIVAVKVVESSANVMTVGPFAVPPADSTEFELVLLGTVAL